MLRRGVAPWRAVAQLAAAVALFLAGALVGRATSTPERDDQPRYLLALHEDARFTPDRPLPELVQEYGAWANALAQEGKLVVAEQLDEWRAELPREDVPLDAGAGAQDATAAAAADSAAAAGSAGEMSGFFLIRADDRDEALAVALTHPHLRYGGRIVLRGVVR